MLLNQLRVSFLTKYVRYLFQLCTTGLCTYPEIVPNRSKSLKASLKTGNFPAQEPGIVSTFTSARSLKNYFSFKKRYSVSSLGCITSKKRFLRAAVGAPGSTHDSRLLKSCDLFADIQQGRIFPSSVLRTREYGDIPFTTVDDSAFPRHTWLMKPYSESARDPRKRYLNKTLCSARDVSEHAYGMLKGRWRILYKKTECKLKNIRQVIMACFALHNICIARDDP